MNEIVLSEGAAQDKYQINWSGILDFGKTGRSIWSTRKKKVFDRDVELPKT